MLDTRQLPPRPRPRQSRPTRALPEKTAPRSLGRPLPRISTLPQRHPTPPIQRHEQKVRLDLLRQTGQPIARRPLGLQEYTEGLSQGSLFRKAGKRDLCHH